MQTIEREIFILFLLKGENNESEILTYQNVANMLLKENYSKIY